MKKLILLLLLILLAGLPVFADDEIDHYVEMSQHVVIPVDRVLNYNRADVNRFGYFRRKFRNQHDINQFVRSIIPGKSRKLKVDIEVVSYNTTQGIIAVRFVERGERRTFVRLMNTDAPYDVLIASFEKNIDLVPGDVLTAYITLYRAVNGSIPQSVFLLDDFKYK